MKFLIKMFNRILIKEQPVLLGRWKLEQCPNRIKNKVDLANEDHCGTCTHYALRQHKNKTYLDVSHRHTDLYKV